MEHSCELFLNSHTPLCQIIVVNTFLVESKEKKLRKKKIELKKNFFMKTSIVYIKLVHEK